MSSSQLITKPEKSNEKEQARRYIIVDIILVTIYSPRSIDKDGYKRTKYQQQDIKEAE